MKKSQAAMEFLMTYGWAILVVIVVIGAISYYGIFNPSNFIKSSCTLPLNLKCVDYLIKGGNIRLNILNARGEDIKIEKITAINSGLFNTNCSFSSDGALLKNGEQAIFILNKSDGSQCRIFTTTQKTRWDLQFLWYSARTNKNFSHVSYGELVSNVEP